MPMRPRIVDHSPVLKAAQQDARELVGRVVLAALARLATLALRRNRAPLIVVQRPALHWRDSMPI